MTKITFEEWRKNYKDIPFIEENFTELKDFGVDVEFMKERMEYVIYPKIKYVICDIPLAIYVSFYRLKKRFNDSKKIFLAININNEEDLKKIISENDIVFIFPHQLKQGLQNQTL